MVDIEAIVARKGDAFVAVDNTFATPVYQRPLELGRRRRRALDDEVPRRALGHRRRRGDRARRARRTSGVKFVQNSVGAVPGPFDCFLVHRGLRTLHLRMAAHTENARAVVEWLRGAPGRERRPLARLRAAWSASATPRRRGSPPRTKVFSLAESLGGVESLIEVPQAMTHQSVEGSDAAVPADLVRLSLRRSRTPRTWSRTSRRRSAS